MPHQRLFREIFKGDLREAATAKDLAQVTQQFPYFKLAHFFALKNAMENDQAQPEQMQMAAMHFNNLFLLNKRLSETAENKNFDLPSYEKEMRRYAVNGEEKIGVPTPEESQEVEDAPAENEKIETNISGEPVKHEVEAPLPTVEPVTPNEPVVEQQDQKTETPQNSASAEKTVEPSLLFEPLHTTDYFASQGIRISEEIKNANTGGEMKSFTSWLKSMKRLNSSYASDKDRPMDPQVERLAQNSNQEQVIVTESMAETFLAQGKNEKAKEIYRQLSLQNPSKSGYFAALLEKIV